MADKLKLLPARGHCSKCGRNYSLNSTDYYGAGCVRAHKAQPPERRIGGPQLCAGSNFPPATSLEIAEHLNFARNFRETQREDW